MGPIASRIYPKTLIEIVRGGLEEILLFRFCKQQLFYYIVNHFSFALFWLLLYYLVLFVIVSL